MAKTVKGRNPVEEEHNLFRKLTRLFSGPILNYRAEVERNMRRRNLQKYTSQMRTTDGKHFKKQHFNLYDSLQAGTYVNMQRHQRIFDSNIMDTDPYISSCLDVFADEMTTSSRLSPMLSITCPNEEIKEVLKVLYKDILNVEYNLPGWCRSMCKYGDFFLYLDIEEGKGIIRVIPLPIADVDRLEGEDKQNPDYVQFQINAGGLTLENWQVCHFRILSVDKYSPFGCCHKYDTRVLVEDGIKEIKDICVGDKVCSFDLETQKKIVSEVLGVKNSGIKQCYKIRTRHNFLETSAEHKILVYDKNSGFEYKNTLDLKIGDLLVINKDFEANKKIKINKNIKDDIKHPWVKENLDLVPDFVDYEFAKLFGFLIGDGWIPKKHSIVCFAQGEYEDLNEYYKNLLEKFSGKKCVLENKDRQVVCRSKMLAEVLKNMGFVGKFNTKRIPLWVYSLDKQLQKAFIDGLYEADGSSFIDRWNCEKFYIEMSNEQLIKDVKNLLQIIGYKSSDVCSRQRIPGKIRGKQIKKLARSYYVVYYKSLLKQAKIHDNPYRNSDEYVLEPIIKIENSGEHETYDIYVENSNHNFISNGIVTHNSVLDGARRVYRQLDLLEQAVMVYRISRSPERRVFYMDVGNIPPQDVEQFMQTVMSTMKRNQVVDQNGQIDLRYNPLSIQDDFFIPVRGNTSATKIDTLPGGQYTGDIEDIKYLRDKLFAALKVPQSFISRGEGADENQGSLSARDIRFARTIQRLQKSVISELTKIGLIHLYVLGYRNEDLLSFSLSLNNPSKIAELQELEHWKTKFDVAAAATEGFFSRRWIAEKIFSITEEEFLRCQREMYYDRWLDSQLNPAENEGPGGGLGDLGSMEADTGLDLEAPEEDSSGTDSDSMLLASPDKPTDMEATIGEEEPAGKRKEPYLTPGAKGKIYTPVKTDHRPSGARTRHMKSKYSSEMASDTVRNVFKGYSDLRSAGRGIMEGKETNYEVEDLEERDILNTNFELKQIFEKLEKGVTSAPKYPKKEES